MGKSSILSRLAKNEFNPEIKTTIGVEFATKTTVLEEKKKIKCQLWDNDPKEKFKAIKNAYYRGAVGAFLVFDITRQDTFDNVKKWLDELKECGQSQIPIILIGNKTDLKELRVVKPEDSAMIAEVFGLEYIETSALDSSNIEEALRKLVTSIFLFFYSFSC